MPWAQRSTLFRKPLWSMCLLLLLQAPGKQACQTCKLDLLVPFSVLSVSMFCLNVPFPLVHHRLMGTRNFRAAYLGCPVLLHPAFESESACR